MTLDKQLETLRSAVVDKPPYRSGTLCLPDWQYRVYYGKDDSARRIDLAHATTEELEHLTSTCDAATFGIDNKNVHDESYRKARKLDSQDFSVKIDPDGAGLLKVIREDLLEGRAQKPIYAELYKLNVYGKDDFFKPHMDTPRSESMFGSLVIVFPTPHEGGALVLRHDSKEWIFDSGKQLADQDKPCIAYTAFFSDVEHEVTPVTSGYRVTLTYNLYVRNALVPDPCATLHRDNELLLKKTFEQLLTDPNFLPEGGLLGFGLHHRYPVDIDYRSSGWLTTLLKGSDAVLMKVCNELSLAVDLKVVMEDKSNDVRVMMETVPLMDDLAIETAVWSVLRDDGGKVLAGYGTDPEDYSPSEPDVTVHWVTQTPKAFQINSPYACYGNEASWDYIYGRFYLIVEVGALAERKLELQGNTDSEVELTDELKAESTDQVQAASTGQVKVESTNQVQVHAEAEEGIED